MIPLYLVALFAHYIADFPVQGLAHKWMGQKATKVSHLLTHAVGYTLVFVWIYIFGNLVQGVDVDPKFNIVMMWAVANGVLHGAIDYNTSKATYWCWQRAVRPHNEFHTYGSFITSVKVDQKYAGPFFSIIGFDQFLHVAFLLWSGWHMGVL